MKIYSHILFDIDRTLLDFDLAAKETIEEIFSKFIAPNSPCQFDYFYKLYKTINDSLWKNYRDGTVTKEILRIKRFSLCLENLNINLSLAKDMDILFVKRTSEKAYLIPHSKELLDYLANKYILGVISNGFREVQYPRLKSSKLDVYFKYVFISDEIGLNKPDKKLFDYSLSQMKIPAEKAIYVGDDYEVDVLGAANANIDQIYFNPTHESNKHNIKPTFQVSSLEQIMSIL